MTLSSDLRWIVSSFSIHFECIIDLAPSDFEFSYDRFDGELHPKGPCKLDSPNYPILFRGIQMRSLAFVWWLGSHGGGGGGGGEVMVLELRGMPRSAFTIQMRNASHPLLCFEKRPWTDSLQNQNRNTITLSSTGILTTRCITCGHGPPSGPSNSTFLLLRISLSRWNKHWEHPDNIEVLSRQGRKTSRSHWITGWFEIWRSMPWACLFYHRDNPNPNPWHAFQRDGSGPNDGILMLINRLGIQHVSRLRIHTSSVWLKAYTSYPSHFHTLWPLPALKCGDCRVGHRVSLSTTASTRTRRFY